VTFKISIDKMSYAANQSIKTKGKAMRLLTPNLGCRRSMPQAELGSKWHETHHGRVGVLCYMIVTEDCMMVRTNVLQAVYTLFPVAEARA